MGEIHDDNGGMGEGRANRASSASAAAASMSASETWKAGGDAWLWSASMHGHAAWREYRKACESNVEADDAMGMVAAAGGRVVDAHGMVDAAAMVRVADAMLRASEMFDRVARSFMRSSRLNEAAAADKDRAAALYERAGSARHAALARTRSGKSRKDAAVAARTSAMAKEGAAALAEDAGRMRASAEKLAGSGKRNKWGGDGAELALAHAVMRNHTKRERVRSAEMLERAVDIERASARVQDMAAAVARRAAEATVHRRGDPSVQEALAAWRKAMAAANRAEAEGAADGCKP